MNHIIAACRSRPLALAVVVATVKNSAADLIVQTQIEGRALSAPHEPPTQQQQQQQQQQQRTIDWRRNAVFAAFGASYLGGVQYVIYTKLMPRFFHTPTAATVGWARVRSVAGQVAFDQFVHVPALFFPCFYVLKESVESESLPWRDGTAQRAIDKYAGNVVDDMKDQLSIFLPGALINFGLMPLWLRTPWVAGVSFVYTLVLSAKRGAPQQAT